MSERSLFGYEQQPQPPQPEDIVAVRGTFGVLNRIQQSRASKLDNKISALDQQISDLAEAPGVNQVTAQWMIESGVGLTSASGPVKEAHAGIHRPTKPSERRFARKSQRNLKRNTRQSRVIDSYRTIYDVEDPEDQQFPVLDRRPGVGNKTARSAVDERLRRQGLLTDRLLPQPPADKVKVGTERHAEILADRSLSWMQRRRFKKAGKVVGRYEKATEKRTESVREVAQPAGGDRTPQLAEKKDSLKKKRTAIDKSQQSRIDNRLRNLNISNDESEGDLRAQQALDRANVGLVSKTPEEIREVLIKRYFARMIAEAPVDGETAQERQDRIEEGIIEEAMVSLSDEDKQKLEAALRT